LPKSIGASDEIQLFLEELDDELGGEFGSVLVQLFILPDNMVENFTTRTKTELKRLKKEKRELIQYFLTNLTAKKIAELEDQDKIQKLVDQGKDLRKFLVIFELTDEQKATFEEKLTQLETKLIKTTTTSKKSKPAPKSTTETKNLVNG